MSLNQLLCTLEETTSSHEGSPISTPSSPSENDNETMDSMPKRKRASAHQKAVLMHVFKKNRFPETSLRIKLAKELGMTPRSVQVWFQNQRQRTVYKNEANAIVSSASPSPSPTSATLSNSSSSMVSNSTRSQLVSSLQSKNIKPKPMNNNISSAPLVIPQTYPFQAFGLPPIPRLDISSPSNYSLFSAQQQQQQQQQQQPTQNKAKISFLLNETQEKPINALEALSSAACFYH